MDAQTHHDGDGGQNGQPSTSTAVSCRLCCNSSVDVDQRHQIAVAATAAVDNNGGGTRPGGRGLRDTIVKHLRIQVSEQLYNSRRRLLTIVYYRLAIVCHLPLCAVNSGKVAFSANSCR